MTTIKALEGRTVHQIQSGQVIVDLCSVVKELVENSLDAGASSIGAVDPGHIRFKNNGLDSIEVQDNGEGISRDNYDTIALKHYTSKLSTYDDLTSLQTFGFRGEALSSLCALSNFHIITARDEEAPKGTRLDFEVSGRLSGTQVIACPKGTMVAVEDLFMNLPVRRRELEKNVKREYGKVLGVLQAYACISTHVKFSVSNIMAKGKKAIVFATKSNPTTRENIANVFGAKALPGLIALNLAFDMDPSSGSTLDRTQVQAGKHQVCVLGHVSRPIFGEGRQAPDRQMFFVNARPCALPQVAKVFNEVYKSYNISQSPFVFANVILDTDAYDVNVSPDKRTILLHDQGVLLDSLKTSLTTLFENQDQTVPQSQRPIQKLPSFKQPTISCETSTLEEGELHSEAKENTALEESEIDIVEKDDLPGISVTNARAGEKGSLIKNFAGRETRERVYRSKSTSEQEKVGNILSKEKQRLIKKLGKDKDFLRQIDDYENTHDLAESDVLIEGPSIPVRDFNRRMAEQQALTENHTIRSPSSSTESEEAIPVRHHEAEKPVLGIVQNAFDRMRPRRIATEIATITIGSKTITSKLGSSHLKRRKLESASDDLSVSSSVVGSTQKRFNSSMRAFAAPGTQATEAISEQDDESDENEKATRSRDSSPWVAELRLAATADQKEKECEGNRSEKLGDEDDEGNNSPMILSSVEDSDEEYLEDEDKKAREDAKVAQLIQEAEENVARPSPDNVKRASSLLKGSNQKDSTFNLTCSLNTSLERIEKQLRTLQIALKESSKNTRQPQPDLYTDETSPEDRLSLIVSKEDFARMRIVGQFNLGFILATRRATGTGTTSRPRTDDLFIIDQHASDEKSNFERLQACTVVQNQRLVKPHPLELTAIEEEIILEHNDILLQNGFLVSVDQSGDEPVGQRCRLLSLPMSREVTFTTADLEELIALLSESPPPSTSISYPISSNIPRPSKVRRMFAMRACRSSVMIGKTLTRRQMERLVGRMGEIDKPWNCPHGRPTMRHVLGLGAWEGWREGDGIVGLGDEGKGIGVGKWARFLEGRRGGGEVEDIGDQDGDDKEDDEDDVEDLEMEE